jgi:hypothetical protein
VSYSIFQRISWPALGDSETEIKNRGTTDVCIVVGGTN